MYTNEVRNRLRQKQDKLIQLAEKRQIPDYYQAHADFPGSPTLGQMRQYIYPEWEGAIDAGLRALGSAERREK